MLVLVAALSCGKDSANTTTPSGISITVTPSQVTLSVGQTDTLVATVRDGQGQAITDAEIRWSSNAPHVVAVSASGTVTALSEGITAIGAYAGQTVEFARVVVQAGFQLPLRRWRLITEMGERAPGCGEGEGGLREDGSRDCSHAGASRYSLDFTAAGEEPSSINQTDAREVLAAADGLVTDTCRRPPPEITCGPNGPFVQIEHPGGFLTVYAHLDPATIAVQRKTTVTQEQTLGLTGAFGSDPWPWLHFELRHENQGAKAAQVLDAVRLGGRSFQEYRLGTRSFSAGSAAND
jgi:hypothetical protein